MEEVNDYSTKASVIKSVTIRGGGDKKCPNLSDVIYGQPLWPSKMLVKLIEDDLNKRSKNRSTNDLFSSCRRGTHLLDQCFSTF
jgi:hypothetical protein